MSDFDALPIFEKDPVQDGVPAGHTAYLLRYGDSVFEDARVVEVRVWNGLPFIAWGEGENEERPAKYAGEPSRLFVRNDAPIDPEVFELRSTRQSISLFSDLEPDEMETPQIQQELQSLEDVIEQRQRQLERLEADCRKRVQTIGQPNSQRAEMTPNILSVLRRETEAQIDGLIKRRDKMRRALDERHDKR